MKRPDHQRARGHAESGGRKSRRPSHPIEPAIERASCLPCAGLGELEMHPAGDALLTRRARSASKLSAIVVRWSKTRKRNERVGVLVDPVGLAAARASIERDAQQ